jgi:hypothetical protein
MADTSRPDKELVLKESGITLRMSYVVFNDILRYVGSAEEAMTQIMINQDIRDLIIRRLLTDHKKPVNDIKDLIPIEEVEIDIFELDDVLAWTMEHVTYFFMRTATKMYDSVSKFPEVAEKMKTSSNRFKTGSEVSQT